MKAIIIGSGPVGIEAGLALREAGHDVILLEAGQVPAASVADWGHVRLFTPWSMDTTPRGRAALPEDRGLDDVEHCPEAAEWRERYLVPLAEQLGVRCDHEVLSVGRSRRRKGDALASQDRTEEPFRLLVDTPTGEHWLEAELVVDASGTFVDPAPLGAGGQAVPGEARAASTGLVRYGPVELGDLAGARVLLVGDGASAVTQLVALRGLEPPAVVTWLGLNPQGPGFYSGPDDSLPERRALYDAGQALRSHVDHRVGVFVEGLAVDEVDDEAPAHLDVLLDDGSELTVDAVVACTGFRPDHRLSRELQVHLCWGSEGTMKLAAHLLSTRGGGGGDCLAGGGEGGPELLASPEPRFFVLGSKSFGRRSDFLLQTGHAQVDDLLELVSAIG